MVSFAGLGGAGNPPTLRRPLAPPNPTPPPFVCTGVLDAPRVLLGRPFGPRYSPSLEGESKNLFERSIYNKRYFKPRCQTLIFNYFYLGGAQSFLVESIRVPTYVFPLHVTLTTNIPGKSNGTIRI